MAVPVRLKHIVLFALLQILLICLLPLSSKLESSNSPTITSQQGIFDKWRKFKSHPFVATGSSWKQLSENRSVCLATQASIDRVHWLVATVNSWSGPISISIFTPDIEYDISIRYITYLQSCFPKIEQQVSFHFVYPVEHVIAESEILSGLLADRELTCEDDPKQVLDFLLQVQTQSYTEWRESLEYPQNLMRNIAKSGCQTPFTLVPDVDMIPSPNLDLHLEKFFARNKTRDCKKCSYVLPVYEVDANITRLPENKTELIELVHKKLAREFHKEVWDLNQKSSNLTRWELIPEADKLLVAYKVKKYIWMYEPVYISRADSPQFDERFIGYGLTRNTQIFEMHMAGYSFLVLNNGFISHWGFQHVKDRPSWRKAQQSANQAKFQVFSKEMSARYGCDFNKTAKMIKNKS